MGSPENETKKGGGENRHFPGNLKSELVLVSIFKPFFAGTREFLRDDWNYPLERDHGVFKSGVNKLKSRLTTSCQINK